MDYIQNIRSLINQKKTKTYDLASKVGVGPNTINNWLAERNPMPVNGYMRICEFFNVPYSYFLESNPNPPPASREDIGEIERLLKENNQLKDKIINLQEQVFNLKGYGYQSLNEKAG